MSSYLLAVLSPQWPSSFNPNHHQSTQIGTVMARGKYLMLRVRKQSANECTRVMPYQERYIDFGKQCNVHNQIHIKQCSTEQNTVDNCGEGAFQADNNHWLHELRRRILGPLRSYPRRGLTITLYKRAEIPIQFMEDLPMPLMPRRIAVYRYVIERPMLVLVTLVTKALRWGHIGRISVRPTTWTVLRSFKILSFADNPIAL